MAGTLIQFFMPVSFYPSLKPFNESEQCQPGTYVIRETDNAGVLELLSIEGEYNSTLHCNSCEIGTHPGVEFISNELQPPILFRILREGKQSWEINTSYKQTI